MAADPDEIGLARLGEGPDGRCQIRCPGSEDECGPEGALTVEVFRNEFAERRTEPEDVCGRCWNPDAGQREGFDESMVAADTAFRRHRRRCLHLAGWL